MYIVVIDKSKRLVSVRDRHSRYKRKEYSSAWDWRSQIISNLNNVIEVVVKQDRILVPTEYDSVVIGSGFGGTVVSLVIAKMYKKENESKRVCILERGQWWISHVIPDVSARMQPTVAATAAIIIDTFRNLHDRVTVLEQKVSRLQGEHKENQKEK